MPAIVGFFGSSLQGLAVPPSPVSGSAPAASAVSLTASGGGVFANNVINNATGNGFSVTTAAGQTLDLSVTGNQSQNVAGTAYNVVAAGGTTNLNFQGNTSTNDGVGLGLHTSGGGTINARVGSVPAPSGGGGTIAASNVFTDSRTAAIQLAGNTGAINVGLANNLVSRPTSGGSGVQINTTGVAVNAGLVGNQFVGGPAASFGIGGTVNGGSLSLIVGNGTSANQNVFSGNGDAGIGLNLAGNAVADVQIGGNQFVGTRDGADPGFSGDGVRFQVSDVARVSGSSQISGNVVSGNAGTGISFLAQSGAGVGGITLSGNEVTSNGGDGIDFTRQGNAFIGNAGDPVLISGNLLSGNSDGVSLTASNQNSTDYYQLSGNQILQNNDRGVSLRVEADADLDVGLTGNVIDGNTSHGIQLSESANTATDSRSITGSWVSNTITGNGGHGISSDAVTNNLVVGLNGVNAAGQTLGNVISGNGLDGVSITGAGSASYTNNSITANGSGGVDIEGAGGKSLTFENNLISDNRGDGLEFRNNGNEGGFGFSLVASGNEITFNDGRGVDVLNQGDADSFVGLNGNVISFNRGEGVYVVNTASTTQDQVGPAPTTANPGTDPTHGMNADGSVFADPNLFLELDGNRIDGNGSGSAFGGTGLALRVGTSDGGYGFTNRGGFASDGFGGVVARVQNNSFSGNFGDDVYIESFTSTVAPPQTDGTWNATTFTVDSYTGDPLARLDLTYVGNTTDSTDVNNLGAFYNNDEPVFKSRDITQTDPGPFTDGERRRNAQRLGDRTDTQRPPNFILPPDTPGGASDQFLYPGMGQSTFRVSAGSDTSGFILDNQPYRDFRDANGVPLPGATFGELPYGWSVYAGA